MQKNTPHRTPTTHKPRLAPRQVRIIGGQWKRSLLPVLDALGLRPTPDRVRETVFNWINHQFDGYWADKDCLDLFAGSGALGFEAASRGARSVTLVDSHAPAVRQLEQNRDKLKAQNIQLLRADAAATAASMAARGQRFDAIFLDPPYQQGLLEKTLPQCDALLKEGGLVYAESGAALPFGDDAPEWLQGFEPLRSDKAGMVFFYLLSKK